MYKILHLYTDLMGLNSTYTRLKTFISSLNESFEVESFFALQENLAEVTNNKFSNELLDVRQFWKRAYDAIVIEGHPTPQENFSRINGETAKEFYDLGGVIFHIVGIGDLNIGGMRSLNSFLERFYLGLDSYTSPDDDIVGFDKTNAFGDLKEFTIDTNRHYKHNRTRFPETLEGVACLAVSDPIHQKLDLSCRTILMGNSTTQLVSRGDYIVHDRLLEFCRVNESGGFFVLLSAYLLEDRVISRIHNDNLIFGKNIVQHFLYLQEERNRKQRVRISKCFISYNHNDKKFAERIGKELTEKGFDIWYDEWEICAGESIIGKVEEGLRHCNCFLLIMSPHSMKSEWVRVELRSALTRRLNDQSITVIPIVLKTCEVPELIRDLKYLDFRKKYKHPMQSLLKSISELPRRYNR